MQITITCDASYDQYTNRAGYGFLISSNVGRFYKSGVLESANNITEGELMAIANAMYYVLHHKSLKQTTKIILNIDFINAERFIMKHGGTPSMKKKSGKKYRMIVHKIREIKSKLRKQGCKTIEFRHVKAHTNKKDKRSKANSFVDQLAVKARKNG